jgi:uncharacterized membrane protein
MPMTSLKMTSAKMPSFKLTSLKMSWLDRFLASLLWLLALLFVAGLVHIVSVFALPELAQKDAYSRLSALTQPGHLSLLPAPLPGQEYAPFEDPALVQGVCLYDLDRGALEFSADITGDGLLTFSFRTRTGRVFYSMTDKAASHGKIDVLVLTPKQLEAVEADDDEEELPQELRLTAPEKKGFVLINALAAFPSERANIEALVKSMNCDITGETEK